MSEAPVMADPPALKLDNGAPRANFPENAPAPLTPPLMPGDAVPWIRIASDVNPDFQFSSLAGRRVIISFVGSLQAPATKPVADGLMAGAVGRFDRPGGALVIVSIDPRDQGLKVPEGVPATRFFHDFARSMSALYGTVVPTDPAGAYRPATFILDERLRVLSIVPFGDPATHAARVFAVYDAIDAFPQPYKAPVQAPVLIVPRIFEPEFCKMLIEGYKTNGGQDSGYMKEKDGKTVMVLDYGHKRRMDWVIQDEALMGEIRKRILRRLVPEIAKAYQFKVTRMERYLVACYAAEQAGHFNAHRDNTTKGTAHRRFAVSINLNAEEFEGGDLVFAEFGQARYRPPTGGACVFSCSMLHEALPVTRGERFVFLPFLYDDAGAAVRQANLKYIA
jgi:predicted 2-oxoglutarate/Fe(II)-dependent dioxygenase YbiX